jgi:hypothetical protein
MSAHLNFDVILRFIQLRKFHFIKTNTMTKPSTLYVRNLLFAGFIVAALAFQGRISAQAVQPNHIVVLQATSSTANNTTVSIVEINKTDTSQTAVQTIAVPDTGTNAIRVSGSATSTLYASNSASGMLFCFTGHNSSSSTGNANTVLPRGVVTLNSAGQVQVKTIYTGISGNQTRCATTLNDTDFYIADQGGIYTNGSTAPSPTGNYRGIKTFGGQVYVGMNSTVTTNLEVMSVSAITGGTVTGLPGLANNSTFTDFYMVSSGTNGTAYDLLYISRASSATAGTIAKYSLVAGSWVANGTFTTTYGSFNILAEKSGNNFVLYLTSGNGATAANTVRQLVDTAGYNVTIGINSEKILFTAPTGTTLKGLGFAPKMPVVPVPVNVLANNGTQVSAGNATPGTSNNQITTFQVTTSVMADTLMAVSFPVGGTFTAGDITNFKLYSNSTSTFPAGTPISTVSATAMANGNLLTFGTLNLPCPVGTRYFWITMDIPVTAVAGHTVAAPALDSTRFTFLKSIPTGSITAAGTQTILATVPINVISDNGTQVAAGNVLKGTTNHILSSFKVSTSLSTDTLQMLNFNIGGTFMAGDLTNIKLFTSPTSTFPGGTAASTYTATSVANGSSITFATLNIQCPVGMKYFWIAADVSSSATAGKTIIIPALDSTKFSFKKSSYPNGSISAGGAQTITAPTPVITLSQTSTMTFTNTTVGQLSAYKSYKVTGINLTQNIVVAAPAGYLISASATGTYDDTVNLVPVSGSVGDSVYVKFAPLAAQAYNSSIVHTSAGATPVQLNVAAFGIAVNNQTLVHYWNFNNNSSVTTLLAPTVSLIAGASIQHIAGGTSAINVTGGTGQNFDVNNHNARLNDLPGTHLRFDNPIGGELLFNLPTAGFENPIVRFATRRSGSGAGIQYWSYATDTSQTYTLFDSVIVQDANPELITFDFTPLLAAKDNPNFRLKVGFAQGAGGIAGNNRFDNFTLDADPLAPIPVISSSSTALAPFAQTIGSPSVQDTFYVSGVDLGADITVTSPANFEISLSATSGYTGSLTLPQTGGQVPQTPVYARLNATTLGTYSGSIVLASTGANPVQVAVSGQCQNVIVPLPLIYYWHFNNLNTTAGDVKEIDGDYSAITGIIPKLTYTGGNVGDRDIDEYTPGSTLNLQLGELEGKAARVRNPSDTRTLVFDVPSTKCSDLRFEYAVHRSGSGQLNHVIDYSVDSGLTWINTGLTQDTFPITETYAMVMVEFHGISTVEDNPNLKIRISFVGNTSAANGNNRFDNITLKGNINIGMEGNGIVKERLGVYPNPVTGGQVHFSKPLNFMLFDSYGRLVASGRNVSETEVTGFAPGMYILRTDEGETVKLMVK